MKFLVEKSDDSKRLDIFLSEKIKHLTRSNIKKIIESKNVKINKKIADSPSKKIKIDSEIEIELLIKKKYKKSYSQAYAGHQFGYFTKLGVPFTHVAEKKEHTREKKREKMLGPGCADARVRRRWKTGARPGSRAREGATRTRTFCVDLLLAAKIRAREPPQPARHLAGRR